LIDFGLETSLDGSDTSTNRLTAPSGPTFNDSAKDIAGGGVLDAGEAQGVWLHLDLNAGTAAADTSVTMQISGNTT
jgi:hypothetical protein